MKRQNHYSDFIQRFYYVTVLVLLIIGQFSAVSKEGFPNFVRHLNLENKWTDNSESPDIIEFTADSLDESWNKCQAEMPNIDKEVIGGGSEPACLQYEPKKYSCICLLKLHKKGFQRFKVYVFYLTL